MRMQSSPVRQPSVHSSASRRGARRAPALALLLAAAGFAAAPAQAGFHFQTVTRVETDGKTAQLIRAEGWVDGAGARIDLRESDNPMMPGGAYLLTRDGGKSVVIVDPEEKTWARYDLEAMLGSLGNAMQSMGPMLDISVSGIAVEKLLEEPGGTIHGLPTTHYRYRTTYTTTVRILGMVRANAVERIEDRWVTDALDEAALGVWLRKAPRAGIEDLDRLIDAEMAKVQGVALKTTDVTTTTGQKGKRSATTRTTSEVTQFERDVAVDPAKFEVPAGYTETQMVVPGIPGG